MSISYLGEYLNNKRHEKRLTLKEIQKETGISSFCYHKWENKKNLRLTINPEQIKKLSKLFNTNIAHIFWEAGYLRN